MTNDFRSELSEEMSALTPPPLGDLVVEAARKGRRTRRLRAAVQVTGSALALAGVAVLATGALRTAGPAQAVGPAAGGTSASATPTAAPTPVKASPTPWSPANPPGTVTVSGAKVLSVLLDSLPAGTKTSGYAADDADGVNGSVAQAYLALPGGTGMVRVFVGTANPDAPCTGGCTTDAKGQSVRVEHVPDNCIQSSVVWVRHLDGTSVTVQLSTCLAWDGKANKPGVLALTEEQAIALGGNPAFRNSMTPAEGAAAAARFPGLGHLTS
ncbi:hypothetical protein [Kitasatospora sp. MMS16-BH015]|uniref:hypothetical protein n=1 Tax=Kitasatospora sp. MMS16-BH015 TaxID=2018025 RepID=UPI000CF2EA2D|nr:hypothetical protein [Kitasatospora sp. MMS16-BH015]